MAQDDRYMVVDYKGPRLNKDGTVPAPTPETLNEVREESRRRVRNVQEVQRRKLKKRS